MCHPWGQRVPGFGSLSAPCSGPAHLCGYQLGSGANLHHCQRGEERFLDRPPPCILGTHHEKGAQTFWSVVNRLPLSGNAVLCWKFCHVFHKLLRDGHSNVSGAKSRPHGAAWGGGRCWRVGFLLGGLCLVGTGMRTPRLADTPPRYSPQCQRKLPGTGCQCRCRSCQQGSSCPVCGWGN